MMRVNCHEYTFSFSFLQMFRFAALLVSNFQNCQSFSVVAAPRRLCMYFAMQ